MNYPVSRTDIKVSKNVENVIDVYVRDIDRKPVAPGGILTMRFLDRKNRRVVASAPLLLVDAAKSHYTATLLGSDLAEVDLGWYDYVVSATLPSGYESLLFTDRDRTELSTVEVRQGPFPDFVDAVTVSPDNFIIRMPDSFSESLPGAASVRNVSGISSFVVFGNHFTGSITVQGSLDAMPSADDTQWFDVPVTHSFSNMTGNQGFTFEGNFVWVRFRMNDQTAVANPVDQGNDCGCTSCLPDCADEAASGNGLVTPIVWPAGTPTGLVRIQYRP
jgi:hypothetical protein